VVLNFNEVNRERRPTLLYVKTLAARKHKTRASEARAETLFLAKR